MVKARAMATASDLFAAAEDASGLLCSAAETLANAPGAMCLVSLTDTDGRLRPYAVTHQRAAEARRLQRIIADTSGAAQVADAFSRSVQRTGGSLRMRIGSARLMRLWMPRPYWANVERVRVGEVLATALPRRGQVLGTLLLWRESGQSPYAPADQAYVQALAGRLALGLSS
jgi:hypothetical protein